MHYFLFLSGRFDPNSPWLNVIFSTLFCLPKKCGTTSYQRALSEHVTNFIAGQRKITTKNYELVQKIKTDIVRDPWNLNFWEIKNCTVPGDKNGNRTAWNWTRTKKSWIPALALYYPTANRYLSQIGKEKISSDDLVAPFVYGIMGHFKDWSFVNPITFVRQNEKTVPIYPSEEEIQKRVINTRNPFSLGCDKRQLIPFGK